MFTFPTFQTGADVLVRSDFEAIAGRRVGFVGNHTSRLSDGRATHQVIAESGRVRLVKLFSPEHGAFGREDHENVGDDVDPATGLLIHSLYGSTRKPTPEMMESLDALVFELQDVGARFYTYASTMLLCLEACAEAGVPLIVLDRPNPLGEMHDWPGPLPDPDKLSFVVSSAIPVMHGLTLGEIALFARNERHLSSGCLEVIACEEYFRWNSWDKIGLPWIAPSPAMKSLETAIVYPGVCLLEQANVSVGRGTDTPFLLVGAPWIDHRAWWDYVTDNAWSGFQIEPCVFTPSASKYAGERCRGLRLQVTNRELVGSVTLGIALVTGLQRLHPDKFELDGVNVLLANDETIKQVRDGWRVRRICRSWRPQLDQWEERIGPHRLYTSYAYAEE